MSALSTLPPEPPLSRAPLSPCRWIRAGSLEPSTFPDSFSKLFGILELCEELGVDTGLTSIGGGGRGDAGGEGGAGEDFEEGEEVVIVPLMSWYNPAFDLDDPR